MHDYILYLFSKFTLKHLKSSYMFRSIDHPREAYAVPCRSYMLKWSVKLIVISTGTGVEYRVSYARCFLCREVETRNSVHKTHDMLQHHRLKWRWVLLIILKYSFGKELHMLPEDDLWIETCRSFLSVLMWILRINTIYNRAFVGVNN
jgi:hypothetical protein